MNSYEKQDPFRSKIQNRKFCFGFDWKKKGSKDSTKNEELKLPCGVCWKFKLTEEVEALTSIFEAFL